VSIVSDTPHSALSFRPAVDRMRLGGLVVVELVLSVYILNCDRSGPSHQYWSCVKRWEERKSM